MRVVKVLFTLIFAVAFGFVIHNNWGWLNHSEPIVFFTYSYEKAPAPAPAAEPSSEAQQPPQAVEPQKELQKMEYRLQTIPLPIWIYLLGGLFIGAIFVAVGALRDIYISRRDRKHAFQELQDLRSRYGVMKPADNSFSSDQSSSDER